MEAGKRWQRLPDTEHKTRSALAREHIIALEPLEKGLVGTLLRYPYEVRSEEDYFDEIEDVKVTKDSLISRSTS